MTERVCFDGTAEHALTIKRWLSDDDRTRVTAAADDALGRLEVWDYLQCRWVEVHRGQTVWRFAAEKITRT